MENNEKEKTDTETILNNILLFSSVKEGLFDFRTPLKNCISQFISDKNTEPSQSLFEYLFYQNTKKIISSGKKVNQNTLIITEQFLSNVNNKEILKKNNPTNYKNVIICIQDQKTLKWNLIAFLNLDEQIKHFFDTNSKQIIIVKILSSNTNSDEDDFILNNMMDKLEQNFGFKCDNNCQFEVENLSIIDQPNTGIFLFNFLNELITKEDSQINDFIRTLFDGGNSSNSESRTYFDSFNKINPAINDICDSYQHDLDEYLKNNPCNTNLDDEVNSDEEEEALKIMQRENEEAKSLKRQKERKLRQKLYKEKLREKDMIMYKEFGVIKEEDNESESESIDIFGKKKEKDEGRKIKENRNNKTNIKNKQIHNVNVNININLSNNDQEIDEIKTNIFKTEGNAQVKNKEKNIKLNALKELEEAIQEFESEEPLVKNTEENIIQKKDEIKNNKMIILPEPNKENKKEKKIKEENKDIPKQEKETKKEQIISINKKEKKKIPKSNKNNTLKIDNMELKKRASVPKSHIGVKKLQLDLKLPNQKITEQLKKSFTSTKMPENKEFTKIKPEKEKEDDLFLPNNDVNTKNNLAIKKKPIASKEINKENKIIIKKTEPNNTIIQNNQKKNKQISINININNAKGFKEEEKNAKIAYKEKDNIIINKEPKDNLSKKLTDLNNIIKTNNISKRNSNKLSKKSSAKISKTSQEPLPAFASKKSTSSSNKSDDTNNSMKKEIKNIKNKIKPYLAEDETIEEKSTLKISLNDNPINLLPPQKIVERNAFLDLINQEKENISKKNDKSESDYSSNINIENITGDFSEKDKKSETSNRSFVGRNNRNKDSKTRKGDKIHPPGKIRTSQRHQYGKLDNEASDKICGCIGEQANGICIIF